MRVGVYPGSFNPPTTAHLAVSLAALQQRNLDHIVWSVSTRALAKEEVERPLLTHRLAVLEQTAEDHDWLTIRVTDHQLLADIAEGFQVIIMGADKWAQIHDLHWYESGEARTEALARLPELAIAPRPPSPKPDHGGLLIDPSHSQTSSSTARDGAHHLMLPSAQSFAIRTGAWIDPARYEQFLTSSGSGDTV